MKTVDSSATTGQAPHADDEAGDGPRSPSAVCRPFDAARLDRQLAWDDAAKWALIGGLVLLLLPSLASAMPGVSVREPAWFSTLLLLVIVGWIWISLRSTSMARRLGPLLAMIEFDLQSAEPIIAEVIDRRPMQRTVRMLLYHRLALLRHRQMRFEESGAICHALLSRPLGAAEQVRVPLLLLLVESRLEAGDVAGAYYAMAQLHAMPLRLSQRLRLLPLKLRYEAAVSQDQAALWGAAAKLRLAELLPAPQCALVHGLMAICAKRSGRHAAADWLERRMQLLGGPPEDCAYGDFASATLD